MLVQGFVNSSSVKYLFAMRDFFFRLAFGPAKTSWAVRKSLKSPLGPRNPCFSNPQGLAPLGTCFPSPQSFGGFAGLVLAGSPTSSILMCSWRLPSSEYFIAFRKRETHLPAKGAAHTKTSALLAGYGEQEPSLPPWCTESKGEATGVSEVKQVSSIISSSKFNNMVIVWEQLEIHIYKTGIYFLSAAFYSNLKFTTGIDYHKQK